MVDFNVRIKVDARGGQAEVDKFRGALGKADTQAAGLTGRFKNMVTELGRARALIGGLFIASGLTAGVRLLAQFGQEMSTVKAITGATEAQFQRLREEAKRLGATTRFSATDAAEGAKFLARAGFDTEQVLGSLSDTLLLAQAGALDLGSAADIASNILQGFRLETDQAGRVVDVLAKAANSSNTNVEQLGQAMKFVAPVAAGLGVSLEEATAAAGALSNAGLQASLAGTGLRRVLSELESPSSKTKEILNQLGVSADQVRISQVGLTTAMQTLKKAGIDTGLALEVFGDRGGPAFEVLSSSIPDVIAMNEALNNSAGFARNVATVMDDNLNGALLAVRSAIQAVIISFGDLGGNTVLTAFFNVLAFVVRTLADNLYLVVNAATGVAVAFAILKFPLIIAFFAQTGVVVRALSTAFLFLNAVIRANPLVALIGLLVTVILTLSDWLGSIRAAADEGNKWALVVQGMIDVLIDFGTQINDVIEFLTGLRIALIGSAEAAENARISVAKYEEQLGDTSRSSSDVAESTKRVSAALVIVPTQAERARDALAALAASGSSSMGRVESAALKAASAVGSVASAVSSVSSSSGGGISEGGFDPAHSINSQSGTFVRPKKSGGGGGGTSTAFLGRVGGTGLNFGLNRTGGRSQFPGASLPPPGPGTSDIFDLLDIDQNVFGGRFAKGGAFTVPGSGGGDNTLVSLLARKGERVNVEPGGDQGASKGGNQAEAVDDLARRRPIIMNFNFPPGTDVEAFRKSEMQLAKELRNAIGE